MYVHDRYYIFKTFRASTSDGFAAAASTLAPVLTGLRNDGLIIESWGYRRTHTVADQSEKIEGEPWNGTVLMEIAPDADPGRAAEMITRAAEEAGWRRHNKFEALSSEVLVRPALGKTASGDVKEPMTQNFTTAIEYIFIPPGHYDHYRQFMFDIFGPLGKWLVDNAYSDGIRITESQRVIYRSTDLPPWNRVHFLTGDFGQDGGSFQKASELRLGELSGENTDLLSALAPIMAYRRKVEMSDNIDIEALRLARLEKR